MKNKALIFGGVAGLLTGVALYEHGKATAPAYPELGVGGWVPLIGVSAAIGAIVYCIVKTA